MSKGTRSQGFLIYNSFEFQQSTVDKMYDRCAVSVYGGSKILICNGGVGTGKTAFIRHLLFRFARENFMITNSILVCGRNNALVDAMATTMMNKIKSSSSNDIPNKEIIEQVSKYFGEWDSNPHLSQDVGSKLNRPVFLLFLLQHVLENWQQWSGASAKSVSNDSIQNYKLWMWCLRPWTMPLICYSMWFYTLIRFVCPKRK